jgi:hypothetical protein
MFIQALSRHRSETEYRPLMLLRSHDIVTADRFAEATGWSPKPEGLCRGELCVPAPGSLRADGSVDVEVAAARLGMPIVRDDAHDVMAVGPATLGGRALPSAAAPDPELLARDGSVFRLSSLRGRKVVLLGWSSY